MRMSRLLLFSALLVGCGSETPSDATSEERTAPPLTVYSSYADTTYLPTLFADFTKQTGIPVVVRHRTDADNLAGMAAKSGSQPADLLLTGSVDAIVQAAEEGLLRPLPATLSLDDVPAALRDPDEFWTALTFDEVVVYHDRSIELPADFAVLADYRYRGSLCLSSSDSALNRAMIAHLIAKRGERDAELVVRGWVNNFAIPPLKDDGEVIDAIEEQRCRIGLVSNSAVNENTDAPLRFVRPAAFDIEAVGIGRHAQSPDDAAKLIAWLLEAEVQTSHAENVRRYPVIVPEKTAVIGDGDVTRAAFLIPDAIRLAERAGYW